MNLLIGIALLLLTGYIHFSFRRQNKITRNNKELLESVINTKSYFSKNRETETLKIVKQLLKKSDRILKKI